MKNIDFLMLNNHQKFFCLFSLVGYSFFYTFVIRLLNSK